jgi:phytoene desaturase
MLEKTTGSLVHDLLRVNGFDCCCHTILHPRYFGEWGSVGGALYGAVRPLWRSGPLHRPPYSDRKRPWLYRVGASVHPGGGIPAVLGGALISTGRLLEALGSR